MTWVTHIDPVPDNEEHIKENFTGWQYVIDPSGALVLTKGQERVTFGPGFWIRIDEDDVPKPKQQVPRRIR